MGGGLFNPTREKGEGDRLPALAHRSRKREREEGQQRQPTKGRIRLPGEKRIHRAIQRQRASSKEVPFTPLHYSTGKEKGMV